MNFIVLSMSAWFLFLGSADSPSQITTPYDSLEACQMAASVESKETFSHPQMGQTAYPFVCVPDNDSVKELLKK